jgi:hypothetical protein
MFHVLLYVTCGDLMIYNFKKQPVDRGTTPACSVPRRKTRNFPHVAITLQHAAGKRLFAISHLYDL